jgi:hypothetical protein
MSSRMRRRYDEDGDEEEDRSQKKAFRVRAAVAESRVEDREKDLKETKEELKRATARIENLVREVAKLRAFIQLSANRARVVRAPTPTNVAASEEHQRRVASPIIRDLGVEEENRNKAQLNAHIFNECLVAVERQMRARDESKDDEDSSS